MFKTQAINCLPLVAKAIDDAFGLCEGLMTTSGVTAAA